MRASRLLLVGLVLAGSACTGSDATSDGGGIAPFDRDGDGIRTPEDCDDGDPSAWYVRPAFRDADGDGYGAGALAEVCASLALPPGWSELSDDCDDRDPAVWSTVTGFPDDDGDGVGAEPAASLCTADALPTGYAPAAGDCDPADGERWRELPYLYRDADGDGVTVWSAGVVCSGNALPPGHGSSPTGVDCDDANADVWGTMVGFADEDRDGAGAGPAVTLCTGSALPEGYVADAYDCAPTDPGAWRWFSYAHRDADGDGRTVPLAGEICAGAALPAGYATAASGNDCDDGNRDLWQALTGYLDTDGDGAGDGDAVEFCTPGTLPARTVAAPGDCAPEDGNAWRLYAYSFRDADGDGYTVASSGALCVGTAPPDGYLQAPRGSDCDDGDLHAWTTVTGYADGDGDGVGAGAPASWCTDGTLPPGFAAQGTDCAPNDRTTWRLLPYVAVDVDRDGVTVPLAGNACSGDALPDPYRAAAAGRDCDDGDASVYSAIVRYRDGDGDGVGAVPRAVFCVGASEPVGYTRGGWDVDDADPAVQWDGADEELLLSL